MSKELLTFKTAAKLQTPQPTNDECSFSGEPSFKGSLGRECLLANRIFCDSWNNPEIFLNCTFVKREEIFKQAGVIK